MRNFQCALLLSHGVPMLQMGDEFGHSKDGNNNTYCHDSELNWVDWRQVADDTHGFARFTRQLITFRCVQLQRCWAVCVIWAWLLLVADFLVAWLCTRHPRADHVQVCAIAKHRLTVL
jgi:hypothetical protein